MALSSARETQLNGIKDEFADVIYKAVNDDSSIPIDDRLRTLEFSTRIIREIKSFIDIETGQS
ncbi:MAG: hypothetical protein PWQ77_2041 [Kosmotogales bacterium]|nr:hypothetical protein [Kosmotogales bacterium]